MPSPIGSDVPPSPKCQKLEETTSDDSDDDYYEQLELFNQEMRKGGGFEIDFSKFRNCFDWQSLDLDDSTMADEPETNRDLMTMLSNRALAKHNDENGTSLELGKILRANFHPSSGVTYYISFEVNDPSDGNQTKPYQAVVRHDIAGNARVISCNPKPPSS
ncbi:unnamed protein product [Arabidopsis lyrata]|uniref:Cystatin domain-containing protein n=1 Tax=Arabidopsis lyrata subsp. lyrata TaxID=81972 RepID=D7LUD8_ARALL|nr:uncharacterized protein LOC9313968 [Arabidopsis lyrata subsp. lyrata]EFH52440.1 hypothetical protein ARALYDRAFT_906686 [Arabidopsis lyrata subsp. lyrata]CAH8268440.1 unnamed protein product [Arabidopsis lyrata]|eukprot:XP_002876181.1 uncharacterized protein LOC9313968 [Arabidopsis lyrata subsp. lyrata]